MKGEYGYKLIPRKVQGTFQINITSNGQIFLHIKTTTKHT